MGAGVGAASVRPHRGVPAQPGPQGDEGGEEGGAGPTVGKAGVRRGPALGGELGAGAAADHIRLHAHDLLSPQHFIRVLQQAHRHHKGQLGLR